MATRSRGSRFTESQPTVHDPLHDDRRTPSELERERSAAIDLEDRLGGGDYWMKLARDNMTERAFAEALDRQITAAQKASAEAGVATLAERHVDAIAMVQQSDDQWRVRWVVAKRDGAYLVRALHLEPETRSTPAGGITTNLLRELSPSSAAEAASTARMGPRDPALRMAGLEMFIQRMGPAAEEKSRRGRPRTSDRRLAEVSLLYLKELQKGRGITQRMAYRFTRIDGHHVAPSTVRDWIRRARVEGFLSEGQMGRAGATAGPRLLHLPTDTLKQQRTSQKGDPR